MEMSLSNDQPQHDCADASKGMIPSATSTRSAASTPKSGDDYPASTIHSNLMLPDVPGQVTRTSLTLRSGLAFEEYERIATLLTSIEGACAWWLGDLLTQAEQEFGEQYAQLVEEKAARTLSNYAWVASKFPPARRREALSWSHHAEVAKLDPPDQDRWLEQAEAEGWTRAKLRAHVRGAGSKEPKEYRCPQCGTEGTIEDFTPPE